MLDERFEIVHSVEVFVVIGGNAQPSEVNDLYFQVQRDTISELTRIAASAGTGKQDYCTEHEFALGFAFADTCAATSVTPRRCVVRDRCIPMRNRLDFSSLTS